MFARFESDTGSFTTNERESEEEKNLRRVGYLEREKPLSLLIETLNQISCNKPGAFSNKSSSHNTQRATEARDERGRWEREN